MSEKSPHKKHQQEGDSKSLGLWMVVGMWAIVLWLLTSLFTNWYEKQHNPNQKVMHYLGEDGVREVNLKRNRQGHYVSSGSINDQTVVFMLDTGASDISVPENIASALGLRKGQELVYQTANGPVISYATTLEKVAIGNIELRNVRASINPNVNDMDILLGMTFLKHLEFTQRDGTLTLRQYPQ